jgi:hypothetical protein
MAPPPEAMFLPMCLPVIVSDGAKMSPISSAYMVQPPFFKAAHL